MSNKVDLSQWTVKHTMVQQLSAEIGKRIRQAREERGLSQQEVADCLSISRPQFTHYETGRNLIGIESLLKLPHILDKGLAFFLGLEETGTLVDLPPSILDVIQAMRSLSMEDRETVKKFVEYLSQEKGEHTD